jgi:DNA-directed RNA polymerase specialized sigma24 family protein
MNNYADYQNARDKEYLEAWKALSPRQRKQLEKAGITGPDAPVYQTHKPNEEAFIERAPEPTSTGDDLDGDPSHAEEVATVLRRLMSELLANSRSLDLDCISLVLQIDYDGASMSEIARRHGITRAAVSKKIGRYAEALQTGIAPGQRQLTTRKRYARRAHNVHYRNV